MSAIRDGAVAQWSAAGAARWAARLCCMLLVVFGLAAAAQVAVPPLRSPVTDLTGTLTQEQITSLDQQLRAYEVRKGSQIAVLIVPTTQPETIEEYGIRVAEDWKLGRRGVNDGVLIVLAKEDRAVRIEVGYGLEGALPDVIANRITDQVMVPRFSQGDYFGGISAGVERVIAVIEGEALPEPTRTTRRSSEGVVGALPILLMIIVVASGILRAIFGAIGGASLTAGLAAVAAWVLTSVLGIAIVAAIVGFILALFSGGGGRGGGWTRSHRGWGGIGGWGGGFGGGFGGGGWSGGGGGFGGGGASGRW